MGAKNKVLVFIEEQKTILTIMIALLGGAFFMGEYNGSHKYDEEKIRLDEENKQIRILSNQLKDSLNNIQSKKVLGNQSINNCEKKELIVYNNTNEERYFRYQNPEQGKGSGYPISSKKHKTFILEGNKFDYQFYKNINDTITLKEGDIYMKLPTKKVIIIDQ